MNAVSAESVGNDSKSPETLLLDNLALVKHLARRICSVIPEYLAEQIYDDLVSIGYQAMYKSAEGYDPTRGVSFARRTFPRVRGSMLDELRRMDPMGRKYRTMLKRVLAKMAELCKGGQEVSFVETCRILGLSKEDMTEISPENRIVLVSLDQPPEGRLGNHEYSEALLGDAIQDKAQGLPWEGIESRERRFEVRDLVWSLDSQEQVIIRMRFWNGMELAEIGRHFDRDESRIRQIIEECLIKLKRRWLKRM